MAGKSLRHQMDHLSTDADACTEGSQTTVDYDSSTDGEGVMSTRVDTTSGGSSVDSQSVVESEARKNKVHELLDSEDVRAAQARLIPAVDAEHITEIRELKKKLSTRTGLETTGLMISGLVFEIKRDGKSRKTTPEFHAYIPASSGERKPLPKHLFQVKDTITVFQDLYVKNVEEGNADGQGLVEDIGADSKDLFVDDGDESSDDDEGKKAMLWDELDRSAMPESEEVAKQKAGMYDELERLGLSKSFDGVVMERHKNHLVIISRNDNAAELIEEADGATFCIFQSLSDVTTKRQRAAVGALGSLMGATKDEVRIRKILIAQPGEGQDVCRLAAEPVGWMSAAARGAINAELRRDPDLNNEQREILMRAAGSSLTLLQGPPGTGKSRTLASAAKAMCKVFMEPGIDTSGRAYGFELPMLKPLKPLADWLPCEVLGWIDSLVPGPVVKTPGGDASRGAAALKPAEGITVAIKGWLQQGLKNENMSGRELKLGTKLPNLRKPLEDGGMDAAEAAAVAAQCASALLCLRKNLLACLDSANARASYTTLDKEMRIAVAAESNVAIDNVLKILDADQGFLDLKYNIVRLGREEKIDDRLVQNYSLEYQRGRHTLYPVYKQMDELNANKGSWTEAAAEKIVAAVQQFGEDLKEEGKGSLSPLLRKQLEDAALVVQKEVAQPIHKFVHKLCTEGPKFAARNGKKLEQFTRDIKKIMTFHIVIRAQVVLGTNASFGELRSWNRRLQLSNAIVLLDEVGQASEPSALVPLTLGAEWVLMAADLKQLRPTIKSPLAQRQLGYFSGGGGSLYGRLHHTGLEECRLTVQYRMHPVIREFPSNAFYQGRLTEDPDMLPDMRVPQPRDGSGKQIAWWPFQREGSSKEVPVAFFDCAGVDGTVLDQSHFNSEEASVVLRLMLLLGRDPTVESIAIVAMYAAQVKVIESVLSRGAAHLGRLKDQGVFNAKLVIRVHTVDGYQGQEADVVIISTVRNNLKKMACDSIGHVADARRLNVAITRAKRALLVVGHGPSLNAVSRERLDEGVGAVKNFWPKWISWAKEKGVYVPQSEVEQYLKGLVVLPVEMCITDQDHQETQEALWEAQDAERNTGKGVNVNSKKKKSGGRGRK